MHSVLAPSLTHAKSDSEVRLKGQVSTDDGGDRATRSEDAWPDPPTCVAGPLHARPRTRLGFADDAYLPELRPRDS